MKYREKCPCCGKAKEFSSLCYECSLPLKERLALKDKRDKMAVKKLNKFMSKTFK